MSDRTFDSKKFTWEERHYGNPEVIEEEYHEQNCLEHALELCHRALREDEQHCEFYNGDLHELEYYLETKLHGVNTMLDRYDYKSNNDRYLHEIAEETKRWKVQQIEDNGDVSIEEVARHIAELLEYGAVKVVY